MKTLDETIETIRNGGAWSITEDILFHLENCRPIEYENKELKKNVTELTDVMAAYRCSWGEMYKEKFGEYPKYPF
ncbi:MAG: hypothetical protein IJI57_07350 [Flexilinea sp.]|nr:hypothetical protein [Flexilinea sp.]